MSIRSNIYYWKCDSPQTVSEKRKSYFQDKYNLETRDAVSRACTDFFGEKPAEIREVGCDGNHFAYLVDYPGRKYFFRADDGACGDEYMLAESELMKHAASAGLPVPKVYLTDCDAAKYGFRFQIMDSVEEKCLNVYHKDNSLDIPEIARQLGSLLKRLHSIELKGFGFIDTDRLQRDGVLVGIDGSNEEYFNKRLDDHFCYLRDHKLLEVEEINEIKSIFNVNHELLKRQRGVLVHRDPALWNVLGNPNKITAIIDWDDAVSGDPADDIGMLRCFYDQQFMEAVFAGYFGGKPAPEDFVRRSWLYCLRNMLWKTVIRDYMGYFQKGNDFFLNRGTGDLSLKKLTIGKINQAINSLKE